MKHGLLTSVPSLFEDFNQFFPTTSFDNYSMDEDATAYHLSIDMPGIKKEDLKIEVKDRTIVIKAESNGKKIRKYHRSFGMPNTVDIEQVEADLSNGVLNLKMPKVAEKSRLIQIK